MKRRFRAAVLLLVLTVLLTTVVFADSGPKPQMAVRVVHAPQEAYYLDLLDEGTYTGAYETDETGLDPALLQAFRAANVPTAGRSPVWRTPTCTSSSRSINRAKNREKRF